MSSNEVIDKVKEFIMGGHASFTIKQEAVGDKPEFQYKYTVLSNKERNCWFIYLESSGSSIYQGYFTKDLEFKLGKKGNQNYNKQAVNGLMWILKRSDNLPSAIHVYHHGKCSVCGRKLTDAESLMYGIGPTCRQKVFG